MTQRIRKALLVVSALGLLAAPAAQAAAKPKAPAVKQEVITIERTAKHGTAALALIGKVKADKAAGFLGTVDRSGSGAVLGSMTDFGGVSGLSRYGHGSEAPLCGAELVCSLDPSSKTLTFTMTETSDADDANDPWTGVTRYLTLRATSIDIKVAAIGFTVKRHTAATFARVTREQADADGIGAYGQQAEAFRAAQLPGGRRGSFAALQLPCEGTGVGAVTFTATGDTLPDVANCSPTDNGTGVYVATVGVTRYSDYPGLYSRTAGGPVSWQVNGLVTGLSFSSTRLFVLSY